MELYIMTEWTLQSKCKVIQSVPLEDVEDLICHIANLESERNDLRTCVIEFEIEVRRMMFDYRRDISELDKDKMTMQLNMIKGQLERYVLFNNKVD